MQRESFWSQPVSASHHSPSAESKPDLLYATHAAMRKSALIHTHWDLKAVTWRGRLCREVSLVCGDDLHHGRWSQHRVLCLWSCPQCGALYTGEGSKLWCCYRHLSQAFLLIPPVLWHHMAVDTTIWTQLHDSKLSLWTHMLFISNAG